MLTREDVASIKACEGVYRAADVARYYGVHRSTVTRVWNGQRHADLSPAADFPDIEVPLKGPDLYDTAKHLLARGYTVQEVADELGVGKSYVYIVRGVLL